MAFIAKRFIYTNAAHTDTTFIQAEFASFPAALNWINRAKGPLAAGAEITDSRGWNTLYEIGRDGSTEDYRNK